MTDTPERTMTEPRLDLICSAFDPEQIKADITADAKDAVAFRKRGNVRDYERYHRNINRGLDNLHPSTVAGR